MFRYHVAMQSAPVSAPDEVIALRAKVIEQAAEIEHLKLVIAKLRRKQFGRSSEQMNEMLGQLELSLEELETLRSETPDEPATPAETREAPPPRKPLPDHLPRDIEEHLPSACDCSACGASLKKLGETVSEMLEYVRAGEHPVNRVDELLPWKVELKVPAPEQKAA